MVYVRPARRNEFRFVHFPKKKKKKKKKTKARGERGRSDELNLRVRVNVYVSGYVNIYEDFFTHHAPRTLTTHQLGKEGREGESLKRKLNQIKTRISLISFVSLS